MTHPLELLLFTKDVALARDAERAGVDGLIVDWETKGKNERQSGCDMETNADTPDDVARVAAAVALPVTVRINGLSDETADEIDLALACGARRLMLPMARSANTGVSVLIDARGRVLDRVALYKEGRIDAALPKPLPPTLYARIGDVLFLLLSMVAFFAGFTYKYRREQA